MVGRAERRSEPRWVQRLQEPPLLLRARRLDRRADQRVHSRPLCFCDGRPAGALATAGGAHLHGAARGRVRPPRLAQPQGALPRRAQPLAVGEAVVGAVGVPVRGPDGGVRHLRGLAGPQLVGGLCRAERHGGRRGPDGARAGHAGDVPREGSMSGAAPEPRRSLRVGDGAQARARACPTRGDGGARGGAQPQEARAGGGAAAARAVDASPPPDARAAQREHARAAP
mmetsp:Transcript_42468/g.137130  ORF Transcript_42468/g.137130 Transcript_42468/m.137130 type:complete len:227 (+) Transcript_42468:571-1251(+)